MKNAFLKLVLITAALLAGITTIHAAKRVKIINGDKSPFYKEVVANVVIDDHKTIIDGKGQTADVYYGEKSVGEYENFVDDVDRGHKSFITYFNEKRESKIKMCMAESADSAEYTLQIKVTSMNVGNAGGAFWGMSRKAGGALINGTMQLVDNSTSEVVCEFVFAEVKGLLSPVFRARAISVYRYLADELLKAVE